MQRTLEDEKNYETQIDSHHQNKEAIGSQCSGGMKAADSTTSTKKRRANQAETSSDEASVTEKHECDVRNQETCEETQEAEFPNFYPSGKGAFGSDIDGDTAAAIETEQVMETETQNIDLNKLAGDTMVIDDEEERVNNTNGSENLNQSMDPIEEDTEAGDTIRITDLLASEVAGSWACDTAPSCAVS
ncbi:hypothetical protein HanHA300_Chr04g0128031 [Helianthus annuus]|nr:hypothetical protein HanHA300_Chr04g0128031 [Helianthus annuus]KAJ0596279.1 hypothetical protein HanHA89_Chr04g0140971 [Helianthus annuus]